MMGELDVAKIKSMFEKGSQDREVMLHTATTAGRTMATLGLSPGALGGSRRGLVQGKRHRNVKFATIHSDHEICDDETDESGNGRVSRQSALSDTQRVLNKRRSMPVTGIQYLPLSGEEDGDQKDQSAKDWRNLKDKLGLSPGAIAERRKVFNRRRTMPRGFKGKEISLTGSREEEDGDRNDQSGKDWRNMKDKLGLSPGAIAERRKVFNRRRTMPRGFKGIEISRTGSREEEHGDRNDRSTKDWRNLKDSLGLSPGSLAERQKVFDRGSKVSVHVEKAKATGKAPNTTMQQKEILSFPSFEHVAERRSLVEASDAGRMRPLNAPQVRRVSLGDIPERYNQIQADIRRAKSRSPIRETRSRVLMSDSQVKSTISREMETLKALQNKAQVPSLIQQFSFQATPRMRGGKSIQVKVVKQEECSPDAPTSAPNAVNPQVAGSDEEGEEAVVEEETIVSEHTCGTSSQFESETGTGDYSYEEVTDTEFEEIEDDNLEFFETSSINSQASFDLQSPPQTNKRKVVLDFEAMEKPPTHVKEQHLKMIADIEILMQNTRNKQETERQCTIKQKMLQDLLLTSRKWGSDDMHRKLQKADLTVNEVSDIVAHINMCEQTNTPVRWDLIKDIVYPNGIEEEPDEEPDEATDEKEVQSSSDQPSKVASRVPFASSTKVFSDKSQARPENHPQELGKEEIFRNQYNLSEDEMGDIMAHLTLSEETGTLIRWDLINCIIHPDDDVSTQQSNTVANTDPGSTMIDAFNDNESKASGFSIYPEFDDCASEVTFNFDTEDTKKARLKSLLESGVESMKQSDGLDGESPMPKPLPRSISESSGLTALNDELLLRKRVHALRASRHGSLIFDRKKKGLPILG
jgi:hypothetical protein